MESKGCIYTTVSGTQKRYSLHPFIIGMFEMQLKRLTSGLYLDTREYVMKRFAFEYYTTKVRQMRVIPIHESVPSHLAVAAYDDIRHFVDRAKDRISVTECICKVGKGLVGQPCRLTDRREVCIGFRDFHDTYVRNGWGRSISRDEALEIFDQNEKDGLVLMPATMQEPQFVCSCCACCCGIIEMVSMVPRSADFVESNYRAVLKPETCAGCARCKERCQMGAIRLEGTKAVAIDPQKCIGCGVCVPTCTSNSLTLARKEREFVPPKDHEDLYNLIDLHRKSGVEKFSMMAKAMMGFKI